MSPIQCQNPKWLSCDRSQASRGLPASSFILLSCQSCPRCLSVQPTLFWVQNCRWLPLDLCLSDPTFHPKGPSSKHRVCSPALTPQAPQSRLGGYPWQGLSISKNKDQSVVFHSAFSKLCFYFIVYGWEHPGTPVGKLVSVGMCVCMCSTSSIWN